MKEKSCCRNWRPFVQRGHKPALGEIRCDEDGRPLYKRKAFDGGRRRFSQTRKSHSGDRIAWPGREDSNLRMAGSKFHKARRYGYGIFSATSHLCCNAEPRRSLLELFNTDNCCRNEAVMQVRELTWTGAEALWIQLSWRKRVNPISRALATSCPNLQLQQCIRIAVRELGHVGWGERDAVEKVTTLCIGGIGIVDREHDAVDAEG